MRGGNSLATFEDMAILDRLNGVDDEEPEPRRSRVGVIAIFAWLLALAVGVLAAGWWWTHPTLISLDSYSEKMDPRPVAKAAVSFGILSPKVRGQAVTVTIDKVSATLAENSASAKITYSICHMTAGEAPLGAVHDPKKYCADLVPLAPGATYHYGVVPNSDYLILTITPTQPGVVRVTGVQLTYSAGSDHFYQRGTQRGDIQLQVTAK